VNKCLKKDIGEIEAQDSYKNVLYDENIVTHIKTKIRDYKNELKSQVTDQGNLVEARDNFKTPFRQKLSQDLYLRSLFNCHPDQADGLFSDHAAIGALKKLDEVQEEQVDGLIEQLRKDYEAKVGSQLSRTVGEIKSDFDRHAKGDNTTPKTLFIDWSRYIPEYTDQCLFLIEKNPSQMQAIYRRIVLLERQSRAHEEFKKQWLKASYGNHKIYQLTGFLNEVRCMENNQPCNIDSNVLTKFQELYNKIEDEIFSHEECNIDNTPYPVVIKHFTNMAHKINSGKKFSKEEMTDSLNELDRKLNKKPMSKGLKAAICGVIGAVIGAIIGLAVGAAITFWGGGFGALPAAIAGGAAGFTLAQGLVVGGTALGVGAAGGVTGATAGFFSAKCNHATYDQDNNAIKPAIDDFFLG
jgi:hypothetical protein